MNKDKDKEEQENAVAGEAAAGDTATPEEGAAQGDAPTEKESAQGAGAAEKESAAEPDAKDAEKAGAAQEKPAEPDWKALYAHTLADFENFRKRTERDREELAKFAAKEILKDLLATADNLALALEKAADREDPFVKGVQLVYDGFIGVLAAHGATPIDSVGEPFDTSFHEALTQQPSDTVPEGHVVAEFKRGWLLNGKLLRAAQVVVSSGKPE